eukprot:TRINITY_DN7313_c0_g1_i3.p1 TRINITY_DN7313_c0_g1~~TRINITY_DN7313_c0_g1_i3.p1  ORF type:complete len:519 (+),score=96.65 TRINITY_DN7313_c0_g1_i3:216-1559(+)
MGTTERILKTLTEIYDSGTGIIAGGTHSLKQIADDPLVGLTLHKPRRRVTVMIVGNHSAGKSSFINWYIGETIQKTGVAIETKGFTFLTSGKRRETLKGDATLMFYSHLDGFDAFEGVSSNLYTEVSSSKERNFSCVDFIDTPGLVDGDIHYAYDVDGAIVWLADHCDLILVFFDPIGQALTARTMDVIQRLSVKHGEKLLFYMSKADQVDREDDRQRVLIQITQNVTARIKSTHAFKLPTFYLPAAGEDQRMNSGIPNAIDDVCQEIDKAIKLTVQQNLSALKSDCIAILKRIQSVLKEDAEKKARNQRRSKYGFWLLLTSWAFLFSCLLLAFHLSLVSFPDTARGFIAQFDQIPHASKALRYLLEAPSRGDPPALSWQLEGQLICLLLTLYIAFVILSKFVWTALPTLAKRDLVQLRSYKAFVEGVLQLRDGLYQEYFKQLQSLE